MKDYFKAQKIIADYLYFYFQGCKYTGQGVITWEPKAGFSLDALMDSPECHPERLELGRVAVPERSDYCSIRIWTTDFGWALIPDINLKKVQFGLIEKHLFFKFSRLVICEPANFIPVDSGWRGNSLYRIKSADRFRDFVTIQTSIEGELIRQDGRNGFYYDHDGTKLVGYFIDKGYFYLSWKLSRRNYTKAEAWRWSIGFQEALQIWLGETVYLLKREMRRGTQKVVEIRKEYEIEQLGLLSLFGDAPVHKDIVLGLADFLGRNQEHSDICRNIFGQILEASNQRLQASQELLVATTLEATMRTLYESPTSRRDNSQGLVTHALNGRFKGEYFSNEWRQPCNRALEAFQRLRIRNAHPDWLASIGGAISTEERAQALDDMIFLCRFYGYMILALAGFRELEPNFPEPHRSWQPAAIITAASDSEEFPFQLPDIPTPFGDLPENASRYARMMAMRKFRRNF